MQRHKPLRSTLTSVLLACLLLPGCTTLYFGAINAGAGPARSVAYAPQRILDLYPPRPSTSTGAVVVFFYGGRWQDGERGDYAFVGERLAAAGMLAIIADYRRWPEAGFPTFMDDAALAVAWARRHASKFGGDPHRLHVAGHSAGGHIAALLGTDARYLAKVGMAPRQLAGVIGIAGPYDFLPLTAPDLKTIFGPPEQWDRSQPVNFVDGDEPPFLLLHGSGDRMVAPHNSASLADRLEQAGVDVEHRVYPGIGHVRILSAFRYPILAPTVRDIERFVQATAGQTATDRGPALNTPG